jgi:outer membrane protein
MHFAHSKENVSMKKIYALALTMAVSACMWTQASNAQQAASDTPAPSRWSIGLGIAVLNNAYAGRGTQVLPFPMINFDGDRLFLHGISSGVHLMKSDSFTIDAVLSPGLNDMPAKDFSRSELANRGINRDDLDNRDLSIDAGFAATWHGAAGRLQLEAKTDISGNSEGAVYSLKYAYPFQVWGFRVTPTVGADFLSNKVADYYYGIHPDEVSRGVPGYRPGGSLIPGAGVTLLRPLGKKWSFSISGQFSHLPGKISASPLVDENRAGSLFIGFSRAL